jgi:tRNA threonylcarbamoyladenosine biosynthesis protein TsaB
MAFLCIETATPVCSVALADEQKEICSLRHAEEQSHSVALTLLIEKAFAESELKWADLQAVVLSLGPGSYTGLRIGTSVAKGIAYARKIPVIGINTLESMAWGFKNLQNTEANDLLVPMLDARRMEVYTATFTPAGKQLQKPEPHILAPDSFAAALEKQKLHFFGNGAFKLKELISHPHAQVYTDFEISASHLIEPARERWQKKEFLDLAYFEPEYLKEFLATTPRKGLLG